MPVQLIVAIIQDRDADRTLDQLITARIGVTRVSTTGGLMQQGNTTLLLGVDETRVSEVVKLLQSTSQRRRMFMPISTGITDPAYGMHNQIEVEVGGATLFMFEVEHFEQV